VKRIKKFLRELWTERFGLLQGLAYILVVGWYGYSMRIIIQANKGIFLTALMVVVGLVASVFTCIGIHEGFSEDEEQS
jgi:hypothetical protein